MLVKKNFISLSIIKNKQTEIMTKLSTQEIERRLDAIEDKETMWEARLDIPFAGRPLGEIRTDDEIKAKLQGLDKDWETLLALM